MKKAEYKEMDTKDLRARLETAEKEYLQTKVNHSISPLDLSLIHISEPRDTERSRIPSSA